MLQRQNRIQTIRKPRKNNQISVEEVRLLDENKNHIGVVSLQKALSLAKERGLDLVEITRKTSPPICRICDYGKYLYGQKKKAQSSAKVSQAGKLKEIRITFNISDHDLETRKKKALEFLAKDQKVRVQMRLKGRQHGLRNYAEDKMKGFMEMINKDVPIKIEKGLEKRRGGLAVIISRPHASRPDADETKRTGGI